MLYITLICSDPECAEELEGWGDLDELETMVCECGCTVQAIAFSEHRSAA
jgi:hypothetical protein